MNQSQLRSAIRSGKRVYGTLIVADSPRWPEQIAQVGLDFVFIDTEHIALDRKALSWMCQIYSGLGLAPIVRIPSPDPYAATMALDAGAAGIVAPYVETAAQVKALHGATKLRPIKGARLDAVLNNGAHFEPALDAYQRKNSGDNILIINIESKPAVDNLDSLLAVEGLDGVLIGPHDLSSNLGIPEQYDQPVFDATVRGIALRARARNIGAGIHFWAGMHHEIAWGKAGMNMLIHSSDIVAMKNALASDVRALREALGDAVKVSTQTVNI